MELPVVGVVVKNLDLVLCGVLLKNKFCGHCFLKQSVDLEVDKAQSTEMVDKDRGAFVALFGKFAV
jgi:hypothetical protein